MPVAPLEGSALALTGALAAETAALEAGDFAGALLAAPGKAAAMEAFLAARAEHAPLDASRPGSVIHRLRDTAIANRAALERALSLQGRIIELVARAARPQLASQVGYGRTAALDTAPVALSVKI